MPAGRKSDDYRLMTTDHRVPPIRNQMIGALMVVTCL